MSSQSGRTAWSTDLVIATASQMMGFSSELRSIAVPLSSIATSSATVKLV